MLEDVKVDWESTKKQGFMSGQPREYYGWQRKHRTIAYFARFLNLGLNREVRRVKGLPFRKKFYTCIKTIANKVLLKTYGMKE